MKKILFILTVLSFFALAKPVSASSPTILHYFEHGTDGFSPYDSLVYDGTRFYGETVNGGPDGFGVVFAINPDGTGYTVLHGFLNNGTDPNTPYTSLTLSGHTLYGITFGGGVNNLGAVFKIDTDGSNFQVLHDFNMTDGRDPEGSLVVDGTTIYGSLGAGGLHSYGVVFRMSTNGTGFTILRNFNNVAGDCSGPYAALLKISSTLYGACDAANGANYGALFSLKTDGSDFHINHLFTGPDGRAPYSRFTYYQSKLYGGTSDGGDNNKGVIYSIHLDGSDFRVLHSFQGASTDGTYPYQTELTLVGPTFYGTTYIGGSQNKGTIFSIDPDGSNYKEQYSFTGGDTDGKEPYGSLTLLNGILYGLTFYGGPVDAGTFFSFVPAPRATVSQASNQEAPASLPAPQSCTDSAPQGNPDLFQITTTGKTAKLYFSPVSGAQKYYISYGLSPGDQRFGDEFEVNTTSGVTSRTITYLSPRTTYYFTVRAGNGCMPGNWGNVMKVRTQRGSAKKDFYKHE